MKEAKRTFDTEMAIFETHLANMKEITLKVPDQKIEFFLELVKHLGIEISQEYTIPEAHINLVRERMGSTSKSHYLSWEEAKEKLKRGEQNKDES